MHSKAKQKDQNKRLFLSHAALCKCLRKIVLLLLLIAECEEYRRNAMRSSEALKTAEWLCQAYRTEMNGSKELVDWVQSALQRI